jgi:Amt family ammonium transporter
MTVSTTRCASLALLGLLLTPLFAPAAFAGPDAAAQAAEVQTNLNYVWTILAAALVFFMQAGFALLETGFTRAKNAVNIIMKNVMDASAGALVFFTVGFGLMFGSSWGGFVGTDGFMLMGVDGQPETWTYAFYFFQAVFAATAATIVSGAVAERIKFSGYLVFSIAITGLIYPIFGSWAWGGLFNGGGWLEALGFMDFAGSTVVHSVGGWAALAGALVVGPRVGKYDEDGNPREIPGHSLPLAALGVFILWLGWFGFNAGSTTAGSTDIALIAMNTFLAAGAGAAAAMATTWIRGGTPDATMTLNGVLGGLVGITAGCANLLPGFAILTGAVAGVLVVYATYALERVIDDPVGAVAVHGVCGAWGTLAAALFNVGAFSLAQVGVQLVGIAAAFAWTFPVSYALFYTLDQLFGLRIEDDLEHKGLDLHEHDVHAYPEFLPGAASSEGNGVGNGTSVESVETAATEA